MRSIFVISLLFISLITYGQKDDCETKLEILKKVFSDFELTSYGDEKVFETKVWEKHACISLNKCYTVKFSDGITALVFNIYLAEDPNEYKYMVEEGIENLIDIDETTSFQGGDQRLIQVLFYDTKNNKFLGKGKDFPLKGFTWLPEGMGDVTTLNIIESFKKIEASTNTCILKITECPSCMGGLHYVFKYHNGKVLTSSGIDACFESIIKRGNSLIMKIITNCYEVEYDNEPAQIEEEFLFKW